MKSNALPAALLLLVALAAGAVTAAAQEPRAKVDIAFVIDATGSMGDDITAVKQRVKQIVDALGGVDARLALIEFRDWPCCGYGDPGDCPAKILVGFTDNKALFMDRLWKIEANGGGDTPEAQLAALWAALSLLDWRPDAYKVVILLTDAPYHEPSPDDCVASRCLDAWSSCMPGAPAPPTGLTMDDIRGLARSKRINVIYILLPERSIGLEDMYSVLGVVKLYTSPGEAAAIAEDIAGSAATAAEAIARIELVDASLAPLDGGYNATVALRNSGTVDAWVTVSASLGGSACEPRSIEAIIPALATESFSFRCPPAPPGALLEVYVNETRIATVNATGLPGAPATCPEIAARIAALEARLEAMEARLENLILEANSSISAALADQCTFLADQVEALQGSLSDLASSLDALEARLEELDKAMEQVRVENQQILASAEDAASMAAMAANSSAACASAVGGLRHSIEVLGTSQMRLGEKVDTVSQSMQELRAAVAELRTLALVEAVIIIGMGAVLAAAMAAKRC